LLLISSQLVPQDNQAKVKSELEELYSKMERALIEGNNEAIWAFYADDAVILHNNAPKSPSKAAWRKKMEERKDKVSISSSSGTVEQAWECGGMVYSVGIYAMSASIPGTARPIGDKGKSLTIFRRTADGRLLIVYDIWNTDIEYGK